MERYTLSMRSEDVDLFERGRAECRMTKSAYVRLLISEHENHVPSFIQYKEVIAAFSDTNNLIKQMVLKSSLNDADRLMILEELQKLRETIQNVIGT